MKNKKEKLVMILLVVSLIVMTVAISYAAFRFTGTGSVLNQITTGSITMSYEESSNVISMTGALPTTDATGKVRLNEGEYFDFTVGSSITGTANINYEIAAQELDGNTIDGKYIKYYLTSVDSVGNETEVMSPKTYTEETTENEYTGRPSNMMSLYTGSMSASTTVKYRLRLYVDESYNPQGDGGNLIYKVRVNVYGLTGEAIEESITFVSGIYNEDGSLYMSWEDFMVYDSISVIDGRLHIDCENAWECLMNNFENKTIVVDNSITSLDSRSFACSCADAPLGFTNVVIPDSVLDIDFFGGPEFTTIYYSGTCEDPENGWYSGAIVKPYSEAAELGIPTLGGEATTLEAGLYDAEGNMTMSWQQLLDEEYLFVDNGTVYADLCDCKTYGGGMKAEELTGTLVIDNSVTKIGDSAFGCENRCCCLHISRIVIPDSVTTISYGAFVGSELTSITIPNSVTSFDEYILGESYFLIEINFTGTQTEWNSISKGDLWNAGCPEITVHCTDGDIVIPSA